MSQKSSVPQAVKSVSQALMSDTQGADDQERHQPLPSGTEAATHLGRWLPCAVETHQHSAMTRDEAMEILQGIGNRLDIVLETNAAALPEPEHNEDEVFKAMFPNGSDSEVSKALILMTLRIEPLLTFFESNITPIVRTTKVEDLAQFKVRRKDKQHARN